MPTKKVSPLNLDQLTRKAKSVQQGLDLYSNFQRVTATLSEVVIDFYIITPSPTDSDAPHATHLQRVVVPFQIAKRLGQVITEIVDLTPQNDDVITVTVAKEEGKE